MQETGKQCTLKQFKSFLWMLSDTICANALMIIALKMLHML